MKELETSDAKAHTQNIRSELQLLIDHLRRDVRRVHEPQAKALFETSAEVLEGLVKAYSHFENKSEEAWR